MQREHKLVPGYRPLRSGPNRKLTTLRLKKKNYNSLRGERQVHAQKKSTKVQTKMERHPARCPFGYFLGIPICNSS